MIRKLVEKDRGKLLSYLSIDPAINIFIIGDVEQFGFDSDFQELWGQFDKDENFKGVLLRYHKSFIPYHDTEFDTSGFKMLILDRSKDEDIIISGKESILKKYTTLKTGYKSRSTFFCELREASKLEGHIQIEIKKAVSEDAERIDDLLGCIDEFSTSIRNVDEIRNTIESKAGRIYYTEDSDGKMISVVQTTAENKHSAMIIGIATLMEHRRKGYTSQILSKLCIDLIAENKTPCLFYDNPKAGRIYHRLGFESIDSWMMIENKNK